MKEQKLFTVESVSELQSDSALEFGSIEEANEWGFTNHVALSDKLDGKVGQNPTEFQQLVEQYGELALVRRDHTAFYDVLAKEPEQEEVAKPSLARRIARAILKR